MTDTSSSKRDRSRRKDQRFIDNAGHMSRGHVERLRQLGQSSATAGEPGFLRGLTDSDRELADSIAEETVANMTSGQQQPPSAAMLEDFADLSIDVPAEDADIENTPVFPSDDFDDDAGGSDR